jgi:CDP-6-deoxy-D-xylo-4-hexulose-3-dehydrase
MIEKIYPLASTTWDNREIEAMQEVIASGNFTMGRHVREFEQAFADYFGSKYAVMSNSGSSANLLALAAMRYSSKYDFGGRDEVIVPAVSWSTTYYPVTQLGFRLKFIDISLATLNADLGQLREAINDKTAGILAVNLLGNPAELTEMRRLADENDIFFIEDNCESMGAKVGGKFAGTYGDIGTFSSFFSHHISTMEGGVCLTDDIELAQVMTSLRAHGWTRELPNENSVFNKTGDAFDDLFRFILPGYNLRPLELSGAIGKEQLKKLPSLIAGRRKNASSFQAIFEGKPYIQIQTENDESSWFGFAMILKGPLAGRRAEVVRRLTELGIDSRPIVAGNFTKNPVMSHLEHVALPPLPNSDEVHANGLFVGNHHYEVRDGISVLESALDELASK